MITNKHLNQFSWWIWRSPTSCIVMVCFLVAVSSALLRAEEKTPDVTGSVTFLYDLISDGDDIGDISITRTRHVDAENSFYTVEENISSKVSSFWGQWEMTLTGKTVVNNDGIVSFDYKIKENKENWRIFGERHNLEFWCSARKVLTKNEKDEEDILAISSMVAAKTIPYAGEALTVIGMLNNDGDREGEIRIPLHSFETTSGQLASFLKRKPKGLKKEKVKVFDTSELKIEPHIFEEANQVQIRISGRTFNCRVFKATKPKGESTYWVAEDDLGAFLVKESGKDGDSPYEVILKKHNPKKKEEKR